MEVSNERVPKWLRGFVKQEYFTECRDHDHHNAKSRAADPSSTKKGDRNYYCVDCAEGPLCETGRQVEHKGHRILQVRKASHTDAIRVNDVAKLVNIDHIQTYSINGAKIVFLPSRPPPKPAKLAPRHCEICNRAMTDSVKFCSISCKIKSVVYRPGDASVTLTGASSLHSGEGIPVTSGDSDALNGFDPPSPPLTIPAKKRVRSTKIPTGGAKETSSTPSDSSSAPSACAESSSSLESPSKGIRKKRRKGVPIRAPGVGVVPEGLECFVDI